MARIEPETASLFRRALICRCPRCGEGKLFKGFLDLGARCTVCGLEFSKADAGDGPAFFLIFILGILVVPPILIFSLHSSWPLWLHVLVWSPIILGLTLGMLRPAKSIMVALQYKHRQSSFSK
ncbi:MAG: DUF983 domain-containing protein [Alphaproteobacteria bacterium]